MALTLIDCFEHIGEIGPMLKSHMDAQEIALVAISKIPANAGHSLHLGTPREAFVRGFLSSHLPAILETGSGELIDANSRPGQSRNQFDIVIHESKYPRLDFGGGVSGFLIESVLATIEVKSKLTKAGLEKAIRAAKNAKSLVSNATRGINQGFIPPKVLNYVVAYDGPKNMTTVLGWLNSIHAKLGVTVPQLPQAQTQRIKVAAATIDGIFVLGKGFVYFDNTTAGFGNPQMRSGNPTPRWIFSNTPNGNLLLLFAFLQEATANIQAKWIHTSPYLTTFSVSVQSAP